MKNLNIEIAGFLTTKINHWRVKIKMKKMFLVKIVALALFVLAFGMVVINCDGGYAGAGGAARGPISGVMSFIPIIFLLGLIVFIVFLVKRGIKRGKMPIQTLPETRNENNMKFCSHCGAEIAGEAVICVKCGCSVANTNPQAAALVNPNDAPSGGFAFLSFLIPLAGLILFLVWNKESPKKAKSCGKGAIIGFIAEVVLSIIVTVVGIMGMQAGYSERRNAFNEMEKDNAAKLKQSLGGLYVPGLSEEIEETLGNSTTTRNSRPSIPADWKQAGDFFYKLTEDGEVRIESYTGESNEVVIPAEINGMPVKQIDSWMVTEANRGKITSVTIPNSVTWITSSAFYGCTSLTSITIPDSVTGIGERAFAHCTNLASVTIPDSVTGIGESAFADCTNLASVTIPGSVTAINAWTFQNCTSLASVTISDGVTEIGYAAFRRCTSLASISIPDGVTKIGTPTYGYSGEVFESCTSLVTVSISSVKREFLDSETFKKCPKLSRESKAAIKAARKLAKKH
jgi:hypothetical protein